MTPNGSFPQPPDVQASAQVALNLRPLAVGELLDRAFHIYFRNIAAFSALLAVVLVPSIVVTYFQTRDLFGAFAALFSQIGTPNATPDLSKLNAISPNGFLTVVQLALAYIALPLAYGAVVVGVSRAYLGLQVTFASCYRAALRRWFSILILMVLWFFVAIIAIVVLVIFFAIVFGSLGLVAGAFRPSSLLGIAAVILTIALVLALIGLIIMAYLTLAITFIAVVLEDVDPATAFVSAIARVFGAQQFVRGFILAIALTGIYLGSSLVIGGGGALLAFLLKIPALYAIFAGFLQLFFVPFAVVTAAVYYYDIRIRREGYDIQMLIDRFAGAKPAT